MSQKTEPHSKDVAMSPEIEAMLAALLTHRNLSIKGACARVVAEAVMLTPLVGISFLPLVMFEAQELLSTGTVKQ